MLRQKWSHGQVETRLANLPPCHRKRHVAARGLKHAESR
jgi:hypothetical protein